MELNTLHLNQMLRENRVRGWNDHIRYCSISSLSTSFSSFSPLMSAGHSSSLLSGHLSIVMSEAAATEMLRRGERSRLAQTHVGLWHKLSQHLLRSLCLLNDISLLKCPLTYPPNSKSTWGIKVQCKLPIHTNILVLLQVPVPASWLGLSVPAQAPGCYNRKFPHTFYS